MSKSLFLNSLNEFMITRRYAKRTIETYLYWIKRYIIFNDKLHPIKLGNQRGSSIYLSTTKTYQATHEHSCSKETFRQSI